MNRKPLLLLSLVLICLAPQAYPLELPGIFSDNMVLQQEAPLKIWGKADAGNEIGVTLGGQTASTKANSSGDWTVYLDPMKASFEPHSMTVESNGNVVRFENILIGEVWLASGQSNMEWTIKKSQDRDIVPLGASDPFLRIHHVPRRPSRSLEFTSGGTWKTDNPDGAASFSAIGYYFGQDLRDFLQVPVGIISSSFGGTPSIAWTRSEAIAKTPQLQAKDEEWDAALARYDEDLAVWKEEYQTWLNEQGNEGEDYDQRKRVGAPRKPDDALSKRRPANLANGMISPIAGYAMKGAIWYQGESDTDWDPVRYDERLRVMIEDWRDWWGNQDMAFGIVQLANFMKPADQPVSSHWALLRESQRSVAMSDSNVGLAVTIDLGEGNDIHPRDKFPVARRLTRWALADVYQKIDLRGGPEILNAVSDGSSVILTFNQTGTGLHSMNADELGGFTVSDSHEESAPALETSFYSVEAEIISPTQIRLEIPAGKQPVRIRYAWQNNPVNANLTNKERLPASPFEISIDQ